jgi:hypothetical protein
MTTTKIKHTPGPWNHRSDPYEDGTPYHRITAGSPEAYDDETNSGFQLSAIMSDADAALIIAAPDLLAAIANSDDAHWTPAMRAAMAKAMGA